MNQNALIYKTYQERVKASLLKEWDPIGVGQFAQAADEYDPYVSDVVRLLMGHRTEQEIFDYLWALETGHMGLNGDFVATRRFATQLMEIKRDIEAAYSKASQK